MGPGSAPWLPVVARAGYLSEEAHGRFWVVRTWGASPFPAWVLVQQGESVLGLNLVPGCKKTLPILVGFTKVCIGLEGIAGGLCSGNFCLMKPHPDRI